MFSPRGLDQAQFSSRFNLDKINNKSYRLSVVGTSIEEVKQAIDRYEGNSYYPQPVILVENYHGLNIVGAQNRVPFRIDILTKPDGVTFEDCFKNRLL
jgi:hypothetical protein